MTATATVPRIDSTVEILGGKHKTRLGKVMLIWRDPELPLGRPVYHVKLVRSGTMLRCDASALRVVR